MARGSVLEGPGTAPSSTGAIPDGSANPADPVGSSANGSSSGATDNAAASGILGSNPGAPPAVGSGHAGTIGSGTGSIVATIRDFKFYDPTDRTTVPDFENVPTNVGADGRPSNGYTGPWDDRAIVSDTLGADNKPVYANQTGGTLTTHGAADFATWYGDVSGTNIGIPYTLPIVALTNDGGGTAVGYDSNAQGVPYNIPQESGDGFFPIDNQGFGDQGAPHNYSFTMEIHTVFTYKGGETFEFRGDDDVFVYVNKKLVINLGGIHGPETAQVVVDSLGLTVGQDYPLDFFSAERHQTGSNIRFETTLALRPAVN
jgi:fibro-slime domain-containing protein